MSVMPSDVQGYFARYGWDYEEQDEDSWATGFRGDHGRCSIHVRLTDDWVYFAVDPVVPGFVSPESTDDIRAVLLLANYEMSLAKFCVDPDGDVILAVELPREGFGYDQFAIALDALSYYAEEYAPVLAALVDGVSEPGAGLRDEAEIQ